MSNPYVQVALTYVRRPFASWLNALASFGFAVMFFVPHLSVRSNQILFAPVQMISFLAVSLFLTNHIKEHFAHARAHLTPNYRHVHLTVAVIATILFVVALPATISRLMGWHIVVLVALVMLFFGILLMLLLRMTAAPPLINVIVLLPGALILAYTGSGETFSQDLITGQHDIVWAGFIGLGTLIILYAFYQLAQHNEELLHYRANYSMDAQWRQKTGQPAVKVEGRILSRLTFWMMDTDFVRCTWHARRASESCWSRICRWQVGMCVGLSLVSVIVIEVVFVHAQGWWEAHSGFPAAGLSTYPFFLLTAMPMFCVLNAFQQQIFKHGSGLLLPIERKDYIRQASAAVALCQFQMWASGVVILALFWRLTGPVEQPLSLIGQYIMISAATQVSAFGVMAWLAQWRSKIILVGVLGLLIFSSQSITSQLSQPSATFIAVIAAALGLLIAWDAYRRWLVADFD